MKHRHRRAQTAAFLLAAGMGLCTGLLTARALPRAPVLPPAITGEELELPAADLTVTVLHEGQEVTIPLEEYVLRATAAEMPALWEEAALQAQAVAVRSYALYRLAHDDGVHPGMLCSSPDHCQGLLDDAAMEELWGSDLQSHRRTVRQAVEATAGIVLLYNDAPACTTYFSHSNGHTESAAEVWGEDLPYLSSRLCPWDEVFTEELNLTAEEVAHRLSGQVALTGDPALWFEEPVRTAGGGVDAQRVGGRLISGTELRTRLGLGSTDFTVTFREGVFTFTTRGHGHRVGMGQYAAQAMALRGAGAADILAQFYPGTIIALLTQ